MKKTNYSNLPIDRFLKELGSAAPAPGGGAAAALTGALGASLVEMVSRIDMAREKKKGSPCAQSSQNIKKASTLHALFCRLIAKDLQAFAAISKVPKDRRSGKSYEKLLSRAASAPLEICEAALEAVKAGVLEHPRVSRWLLSDLVEAIYLLEASFKSAKLNVEINLKSMKDTAFIRSTKTRLAEIQDEMKSCSNLAATWWENS